MKLTSLLLGAIILVAGRANAIPISGEVHFVGSFSPTGGAGLGDATGLSFGPSYVFTTSGSFSSLAAFSSALFNSITFAPLSPGTLWTAGDFSFALENVTIDLQSATQLNLSGTGMLTGPVGYDPTPGTWNFQGGGSAGFTFRTDNTATVPDGGSALLLLGVALAGVGVCRRLHSLAA
ncbi:MAG TPA: hypothetical protein VJW76_09595 [Verrucomicrobiae bacterium]|nr:hypothetical protein [Verrucomicrobiae bacterium]